MDRDDIIRIARKAGFDIDGDGRLSFYAGDHLLLKPGYQGTVIDGIKKAIELAYIEGYEAERLARLGKHHVWCNDFLSVHADNCSMCSDLRGHYPEDGKTPDELQKEHFPNAVKIGE